MDEDIREALDELGKHVQAIGRMIGSKKSTIESLSAMSECLADAQTTLNTYVRIQKRRYVG